VKDMNQTIAHLSSRTNKAKRFLPTHSSEHPNRRHRSRFAHPGSRLDLPQSPTFTGAIGRIRRLLTTPSSFGFSAASRSFWPSVKAATKCGQGTTANAQEREPQDRLGGLGLLAVRAKLGASARFPRELRMPMRVARLIRWPVRTVKAVAVGSVCAGSPPRVSDESPKSGLRSD